MIKVNSLIQIWIECSAQVKDRIKLSKHIRIALFVGIILNLINQFDPLVQLEFSKINFVKAFITFLVPFAVSVYSAATINNSEKEK